MSIPRRSGAWLGIAMALVLPGCGQDDSPTVPPAHFTDPAALVAGFTHAFTARNAGACADLLDPSGGGFRFYPKTEDLPNLAWLAGSSWGYEKERQILSDLFDPSFASEEAAAAGFSGVGALALDVDSVNDLSGGRYDVMTHGTFALKVRGASDRAHETSLRLVLATSTSGDLVIREMHELSGAGSPSWAAVQSWYRGVLPRYTDPAALVAAHAAALESRDLEAYESLLADGFQYFPQTQDLLDLTWMTGNSWTRADETEMIRHMFDPLYQPVDPHVGGIDTITANVTITSVAPDPSGSTLVSAHAVMQVMYDAPSGARCDVVFVFRLEPHDGHLLIADIHELPYTGRAVERQDWGVIKALYR